MEIVEILDKAKDGYERDGYLGEFYDPSTGEPDSRGGGDGLARFVVDELLETYDLSFSDEEQLDEARRVMNRAIEQLSGVVRALGG